MLPHIQEDFSMSMMNANATATTAMTANEPLDFVLPEMGDADFSSEELAEDRDGFATVYKGNIIKNLIMDCQSYTKYRPNETTGGIFVSWRRKEELATGA